MGNVLHWLPFQQQLSYQIYALVWTLFTYRSSSVLPRGSIAVFHSALQGRLSSLSPSGRLLLSCAVPFPLLTLQSGMTPCGTIPNAYSPCIETAFYSNLKTVLFCRVLVWSAPE